MSKNKPAATSRKKGLIVCGSVGTFIIVLLTVVTVLTSTTFYNIICTVLGGERAKYSDDYPLIYEVEYDNKKDSLKAANALNEKVCEEGFVLLKNNNDALPLKTPETEGSSVKDKPKVSIFGKNSVNIAYGGSGSGSSMGGEKTDLYESLSDAGYDLNPQLKKFYESKKQSGEGRSKNSSDLDSGDSVFLNTGETPQSSYTKAVKESYAEYNDMALIVLTRIGGEGFDLPRTMKGVSGARSDDDHYLQLDENEAALIKAVTEANFKRVVVIVNSASAMELGFLKEDSDYVTVKGYDIAPSKIDAAIWMGFPGESGAGALGKILNGNVNPSGKLSDTYVTDLKNDPTWNNFGDNNILPTYGKRNGKTVQTSRGGDQYVLTEKAGTDNEFPLYYFVDYEEGVYVGYKYYETRGVTDGEDWYNKSVVYPFGYGLSYTEFEWSLKNDASIRNKNVLKGEKYTVTVTVKNVGQVAGKEVVQLYGHAPYFDGEVEKPEEVLLDFAKTKLLQPGEEDVVTLTFDPYYLASYDYKNANGNAYTTFELDASTAYNGYSLYVSRNAHDKEFTIPFNVEKDIAFDTSTAEGQEDVTVKNRYTGQDNAYFDSDYQLTTVLSRSDWEGTWPTAPDALTYEIDDDFLAALKDVSHNNPNDYSEEEMPWFDVPVEITFRDMLTDAETGEYGGFVSYDDDRWETILDECNVQELITMFDYAAFTSKGLTTIGKPATNDTDGPAGFTNFMDQSGTYGGTCNYCAEVVMSATWNVDLIQDLGEMVGNEGILGADGKGNGLSYSGWYAPGANIHRSAFGGRNFEYFSEDGVLSGKMAAAEITGCQSKGVYCFMKHFALNEQETHRSISGDCSWVTEQAMRETYLRPFEIAVKEGETRAIMTSFNRIGTRWTGGDYRLLTEILREEWGFKGTVICDFNTIPQYMNSKQMAYAGGDLNLVAYDSVSWCDASDVSDLVVLRRAAKNVLYTVVNSNAMNREIVGYKMPLWQVAVIVLDCAAAVGIGVWGFFAIKKYKALKAKSLNA